MSICFECVKKQYDQCKSESISVYLLFIYFKYAIINFEQKYNNLTLANWKYCNKNLIAVNSYKFENVEKE